MLEHARVVALLVLLLKEYFVVLTVAGNIGLLRRP
jgi:hypothetical protein